MVAFLAEPIQGENGVKVLEPDYLSNTWPCLCVHDFFINFIVYVLLLGSVYVLLFGGQNGVVIAFFFAVVMNFGSYWFSDKIVLTSQHRGCFRG